MGNASSAALIGRSPWCLFQASNSSTICRRCGSSALTRSMRSMGSQQPSARRRSTRTTAPIPCGRFLTSAARRGASVIKMRAWTCCEPTFLTPEPATQRRATPVTGIDTKLAEYRALRLAEPARWPLTFDQHNALTDSERTVFEAYLAREAPLWQIHEYLWYFDSFARPRHLVLILTQIEAPRFWQVFLENWNVCDHPWRVKTALLPELRRAKAEINPVRFFGNAERTWFDAQSDTIVVYRGSQRGCTRGISWTTDRVVAGGFAQGKRCNNTDPVMAQAVCYSACKIDPLSRGIGVQN
jgi:hypothetical protein